MATSENFDDIEHDSRNKGKAKAPSQISTEATPLLGTSRIHPYLADEEQVPADASHRERRHLCSLLVTVFLTTLCITIVIFIIVILLAYSYSSWISRVPPEDLIQRALVIRGPRRVDVLNVTTGGEIWLRAEVDVGVDAGDVMGVNEDEDDGLFTDIWKSIGRWGVKRMDSVTAQLSTINISSIAGESHHLASVQLPELTLPLTVNPPKNPSDWLTRMQIPVHIVPTNNGSELLAFVQSCWRDGVIGIQTHVGEVRVHGGKSSENSWRRRLNVVQNNVETIIRLKIPQLPGLPSPGRNHPFPEVSDMVKLQSFRIQSENDSIVILANATLVNPASSMASLAIPPLPFIVSLPNAASTVSLSSPVPVASVHTLPFLLEHTNTTFSIIGGVLPIPHAASPLLSSFLSDYLTEHDAPIVIHSPLFPSLQVNTMFPAPRPRPHILRDVAIRNMRMTPEGNKMLVTGIVYARVVLPRGVQVDVDVERIWPDVLVFDGEVPDDDITVPTIQEIPVIIPGTPESDPAPPLPDPLPRRAFARIRPEDWLVAHSTPINSTSNPITSNPVDFPWPWNRHHQESSEDSEEGAQYTVTARVVDVPLQVLPGRDKEFRSFVGKVVFGSQGALAGVQGVAGVALIVDGLPILDRDPDGEDQGKASVMELHGLPFKGAFRVGKKLL